MKKILKLSFLLIIVVSLIANAILGILYVQTNKLNNELKDAQNDIKVDPSIFSSFPTDLIKYDDQTQTFAGGRYTVFVASKDLDAKQSSIWIYDSATDLYSKLVQSLDYRIYSTPIVSPDESKLAFMQVYPYQIIVLDLSTFIAKGIYSETQDGSKLAPSIGFGYKVNLSWLDNENILFENNREINDFVQKINISSLKVSEYELKKANIEKKNVELTVPHLSQRDPAWKSQRLGTCEKQTIESAGCAMTALNMVMNFYKNNLTPEKFNTLLTQNKEQGYFDGCDVKWYMPIQTQENLRLKWVYFNETNFDRIHKELNSGNPVVLGFNSVPYTKVQHWVVVTGYKDGEYLINDPWDLSANTKTLDDFGGKFDHMVIFEDSQI